MTTAPVRLLLLEDNPGDARLVQVALAEHAPCEFAITTVGRLADALARIGAEPFDAVLCDLGLPDSAGLATAQAIAARVPALPLVVLTGSHDQSLGREAIQHGAQDYLVKGESGGALIARTLRYAIERARLEIGLRTANDALERRVSERTAELETALTKLRESLSSSQALAETASDAIITADHEGSIVGWNRAAERMFGYAQAEAVGQALTLVIPERYRGDHWVGVKRVLADGERHIIGRTVELLGLTKAGSEFPLELSLSDWETSEGRMFAGIIRDTSERKREEHRRLLDAKRLEASLALSKMLGESEQAVLDFILEECLDITESRHSFIGWINKDESVMTVHAWSKDAMAQCAVDNMPLEFPLAEAGLWAEPIRQRRTVIINDCAKPHEHKRGIPAGHVEIKRYLGVPIFERDRIVMIVAVANKELAYAQSDADSLTSVMTDARRVIQRNRAEEALRAAEEQFRSLVEQPITGIYIVQDGKFAYVNPRLAEILGYGSAAELIGRDPLSTVAEKGRGMVAENIRRRFEGEVQRISYGFTALRKDGSTIEVGVHGARATFGGQPAIIGLMQDISEKKRAEEQVRRYLAQLETAFMSTVQVATTLSEMRDPYTAGHERRVAHIAVAIGAELGFDARRQDGLRVAGHLHDIGKITIPSEILSKPGKLSATEFQLIQGHAQASYDVLKDVEFPWPVAQVALQHHERIDGSGYPQGLKGEAILIEARIMAVADVIEAMSSHRPYRPGLGIDKALAEIERGRGTAYDMEVADACLKLFREKGYTVPA